jgi:murein DD-endopeptidase MepM/ murein hydrolase activator NlpD
MLFRRSLIDDPAPFSAGPCQLLHRAVLALCLFGVLPHVAAQSYTTAKLADGFDFPVGKPNSYGYYVFRGFSSNGHLGEDWNGNGGGNSDEGDPVYSIAHGVVVFSEDYAKGWGNVVIIRHGYREKSGQITYIDSLYGHLKVRSVAVGEQILRGQKVGTIGCGPYRMYEAHLHFEIRKDLRVGMRRDLYPQTLDTYYSPRSFLNVHRALRNEDRTVRIPVNTFLKSNPNRMSTEAIEIPEITVSDTVRPLLPEELEAVINAQTSPEMATPEKTRSKLEEILKKMADGGE